MIISDFTLLQLIMDTLHYIKLTYQVLLLLVYFNYTHIRLSYLQFLSILPLTCFNYTQLVHIQAHTWAIGFPILPTLGLR